MNCMCIAIKYEFMGTDSGRACSEPVPFRPAVDGTFHGCTDCEFRREVPKPTIPR
eukprot:COSAG02_NODE_4909_length_4844_cov_3.058377_3_plen_55_part_00